MTLDFSKLRQVVSPFSIMILVLGLASVTEVSRSSASAIVMFILSWCFSAGSLVGIPLVHVGPLEWGSSFVVVASICLSASSVVVSEPPLAGCVGREVLLALVEDATHVLIVEFAA